MLYDVTYSETYSGIYEIEAGSKEEAYDIFMRDFDYYARRLFMETSELDVQEAGD